MDLQPELNLWDGLMMVVGSVVGVGIFTTTGIVAQYINHPLLLLSAWLAGGGLALAGALTVGELGAALPKAGGDYVYLREAYPPPISFLYGWACFWASFSGTIAILAIALADYLSHLIPFFSLKNLIIRWPVNLSWGHVLAILAIMSITFFNCLGVKQSGRFQNFLTVSKILLISGMIWLGFGSKNGNWNHFQTAASMEVGIMAFFQGLVPVWFTYSGWNAVTYLGEELKSPGRNLPLACGLGILLSILIYIPINILYIYALPVESMSGVVSIAQSAMTRLLGKGASGLVSAVIALSILGCLNATIIVGARIYYAMARDRAFFRPFARLHPRHRTPVTAILGQGLWACILLISGTFSQLLNFTVFVILIFSALTAGAVFRLRKSHPDLPRPYRVFGYPFTPAIFITLCLSVAVSALIKHPLQAGSGLLVILAGLPAYRFWQRSENS